MLIEAPFFWTKFFIQTEFGSFSSKLNTKTVSMEERIEMTWRTNSVGMV